ncbi:Na(+)/dicarboxylate cotransporter 3-like [Ptychodera flava]|uniref:Na(+)/dicarboxylate cotransporter 3-like n=1 Tax=Ptychodera flava TaxID=63121 RepID=UPI00396A04EE
MVQNRTCRLLLVNRDLLITLLTPLLLSPIPIVYKTALSKCLYILLLMLVYLLLESLPLAIVGLLPAVAFPLLGIMDAATLGKAYFSDQLLFIIGVLIISSAVERTDLHKRVVLRSLLLFGSNPYGLLLGTFIISGFLSMWLPNVAMMSMMLPIGQALGAELDRQMEEKNTDMEELGTVGEKGEIIANQAVADDLKNVVIVEDSKKQEKERLTESNRKKPIITSYLLLSMGYGNTIGGSATLIGTIVPIVANAQLSRIYGPDSVIEFDAWIQFGLPLQLACLTLAYIWLVFLMWISLRKQRRNKAGRSQDEDDTKQSGGGDDKVKQYVRSEYAKLGGMKWSEVVTIFLMSTYVLLLFFADLQFMKGWKSLFPKGYTSNTCITCGIAILLFIIPYDKPNCRTPRSTKKHGTILEWRYVSNKLPWELVLIIGGYFALAEGIRDSGISSTLEGYFEENVGDQEPWVILLILTVTLAIATELMSNVPVVIITFPIIASLASATSVNPLYYIVSSVFAVNLTFMLPISAPPIMILYTSGSVTVLDMLKAGWMMNIMTILLLNVFINTYGYVIFDFDTMPAWAIKDTTTMASPLTNITNESSTLLG